jgi:hypothetical protein
MSRPHRDIMHVAGVQFKCFRYFRGMFQLFHTDVVIDRDVAHVAMTIHVCCKCMFQMFLLFQCMLQVYILNNLAFFKRMLQVFYLDVAYVASVCFKCFTYFKRTLQVFYMNVVYDAVPTHIYCKRML